MAFRSEIPSIVDFLLPGEGGPTVVVADTGRVWYWDWASPFCSVLWATLRGFLPWVGFRLTRGARGSGTVSYVVVALYILLLLRILTKV
jgi:hypothetical protein